MILPPDAIIGVTSEGKPVTGQQVEEAACVIREFAKRRLADGSISQILIYQLAGHYCRMPQLLGKRWLLADMFAVLDQIGELEGTTGVRCVRTKAAAKFELGALSGLWRKHWFQADFLATNLLNEIEKAGEGLTHKRLNELFGKDRWQGQAMTKSVTGALAQAMVDGALTRRSGGGKRRSRLTGEWIIFSRAPRRKIYLTLASHTETNEQILARCALAPKEFPELATTPPFVDDGVSRLDDRL